MSPSLRNDGFHHLLHLMPNELTMKQLRWIFESFVLLGNFLLGNCSHFWFLGGNLPGWLQNHLRPVLLNGVGRSTVVSKTLQHFLGQTWMGNF